METLSDLSIDIKRHIEALHKTADVCQKVETRVQSLGIDLLHRQVASQAQYLEKTWAMLNEINSSKRQQEMMTQISVQMFHLLQGKDWLHNNVGVGPQLNAGENMSVCETIEDGHSPLLLPRSESRAMSDAGSFADEGFDPFSAEPVQPCHLDGELATTLQDWLMQPQPTFLWISGPADLDDSSITRSMAQAFIRSLAQAGVPILWHSCVLRADDESSEAARMHAFQRLLRAIIKQLIRLSRTTRTPSPGSSPTPLAQRSGSVEDLLEQLEILLQSGPPILFCSIDDFHLLEDPAEDNVHLMAFLCMLRKHSDTCQTNINHGQGSRIFKVLMTTKGQSWALSSELDPEEICNAVDDWRASLHPGEEAPGRLPLTLAPSINSLSVDSAESRR